ncbi:hypothetical protein GCM10009743_40980 [Kribbella swartbergensis]
MHGRWRRALTDPWRFRPTSDTPWGSPEEPTDRSGLPADDVSDRSTAGGSAHPPQRWDDDGMVDNFLSAGTQDDDELPSPYGTGPKNRTTEEHRRSDYDNDTWRDRPNGLGLDPSPSLPNAPRAYERGPVPQQPYVPKPPYLPGPPPPPPTQQPQQPRYGDQPHQRPYGEQPPEYYNEPGRGEPGRGESGRGEPGRGEPARGDGGRGEVGRGEFGRGEVGRGEFGRGEPARGEESPFGQYQEQSPFRPQQPQQPPAGPPPQPSRPSPFGPGSNGVPPNQQQAQGPSAPQQRPPAPPHAGSNGLTQHPPGPHGSNGTSNASWSGPAPAPAQNAGPTQSNGVTAQQPHGGPSQPPTPPPAPAQPQNQQPQNQQPQQPPHQRPASAPPNPSQGNYGVDAPTITAYLPEMTEGNYGRVSRGAGQSDNAYPSDPSAEYESNTPVSEDPKPVGARRRADVQHDAPSQVPAEHTGAHRARRAQPTATPAPPTADVAQRTAEVAQPAQVAEQPAEIAQPTPDVVQPVAQSAGLAQPTAESAQPTAGVAQPTAESAQPAAEVAQPVADADQSAAEVARSAAASAEPTAQAGGSPEAQASTPSSSGSSAPAGPGEGSKRPRRYRIHHLRDMKNRGEKWAMLTAYDMYTAEIFDHAGIPVLLVGDSAANNVFGYDTTLRVTVDELIPLARAVAGAVERALVVADLPFGSYQASPEQAFHTAVRFMKEAGVHAVKLEGGRTVVPMVEKLTQSGIPVMAHIGFTPQSEHSIGGYRVQGRGDQAAGLIDDAIALAEAGAFSVVLEMVPGDVAAEITKRVTIPTIGIGAGRDTDAQVLVWQDMAGMRSGTMPRFVKQYADLRGILTTAATTYAAEVASGTFPTDDHTF